VIPGFYIKNEIAPLFSEAFSIVGGTGQLSNLFKDELKKTAMIFTAISEDGIQLK
jgi:hypothetical protein